MDSREVIPDAIIAVSIALGIMGSLLGWGLVTWVPLIIVIGYMAGMLFGGWFRD